MAKNEERELDVVYLIVLGVVGALCILMLLGVVNIFNYFQKLPGYAMIIGNNDMVTAASLTTSVLTFFAIAMGCATVFFKIDKFRSEMKSSNEEVVSRLEKIIELLSKEKEA